MTVVLLAMAGARAGAAEANDSFANAIALPFATNLVTSNAGASAEPGEPQHANEPPTHSLWWRWTAPFTGTFSILTTNSTFDTVLGVYIGNALSNLAPVASSDDFDIGVLWSGVIFRAYAGETLHLAVDGVGGSTGTIRLSIGTPTRYMPAWTAYQVNGGSLRSTNFAGQVLLIDLWETTCGPCIAELPGLSALHADLHPRGFSLIGLAIDGEMQVIDDFLADNPLSYPVAKSNPDAEKAIGGTLGVPIKYLVDREGRIAARYPGAHDLPFYENVVMPMLRPPPNVSVAISRAGNSVKISWPATGTGYEVQSVGTLSGGAWNVVDAPIETLNARNVVTIPIGDNTQFFRLLRR